VSLSHLFYILPDDPGDQFYLPLLKGFCRGDILEALSGNLSIKIVCRWEV
jgi:hypothetical protein